jgi:hypothetical protein
MDYVTHERSEVRPLLSPISDDLSCGDLSMHECDGALSLVANKRSNHVLADRVSEGIARCGDGHSTAADTVPVRRAHDATR